MLADAIITPGVVEALRIASDAARAETIAAHLELGTAERRYRAAMAAERAASKRLLDARVTMAAQPRCAA